MYYAILHSFSVTPPPWQTHWKSPIFRDNVQVTIWECLRANSWTVPQTKKSRHIIEYMVRREMEKEEAGGTSIQRCWGLCLLRNISTAQTHFWGRRVTFNIQVKKIQQEVVTRLLSPPCSSGAEWGGVHACGSSSEEVSVRSNQGQLNYLVVPSETASDFSLFQSLI